MFLDTNEWIYSGPKVVRYSRHFRHHQMIYWKLRSWWNRVIVWRLPRPSQLSIAQYVIVNRWISSGQKLVRYSHHSRHLQTIYWKLRSWRNRVIWCLPDRADFSLRYISLLMLLWKDTNEWMSSRRKVYSTLLPSLTSSSNDILEGSELKKSGDCLVSSRSSTRCCRLSGRMLMMMM